jgi:hypothetical protein
VSELRLYVAQGFGRSDQLAGPLDDPFLELLVQSLDLGLRLLEAAVSMTSQLPRRRAVAN